MKAFQHPEGRDETLVALLTRSDKEVKIIIVVVFDDPVEVFL
jgi:hypothetical protein